MSEEQQTLDEIRDLLNSSRPELAEQMIEDAQLTEKETT